MLFQKIGTFSVVSNRPCVFDYERYYSCASNEYILKNGGNGYNMFKGDMIDMGRVITDADSLKEYLEYLGGSLPAEYSDEDGQGRMNFLTAVE